MAKKNNNNRIKRTIPRTEERDNRLPQNIISIGEREENNKNIYILQPVYKLIHRFSEGKTKNESGGMLVGDIIEDFGKTNIVVSGFIEAKYCEATPTTLKFTHQTWEYCHKEIEKNYPGKKIVGWIHTHPDFGIFLSEYDKFIQENFFKEDYQVAYVVDPIQGIEGFYFWINGKIERCKGFYIYDKIGAKINIITASEESPKPAKQRSSLFDRILIAVLLVSVLILFVSVAKQNQKIETLQKQQESIIFETNRNLNILYQQIDILQGNVNELSTIKAEDTVITEQTNESPVPSTPIETESPTPVPDEGMAP